MQSEAMEKVPGGKLLRIKVAYDDKITKVDITGDFFAHPEECIEKIENQITGLPVDFKQKKFTECLTEFIERNQYELIGIDAEAIIRVLKEALKQK